MNNGVIYKCNICEGDNNCNYFLRLDRNVKIGEVEYNIYIDASNKKAKLFSIENELTGASYLVGLVGKKFDFAIEFKKDNNEDVPSKIIGVSINNEE